MLLTALLVLAILASSTLVFTDRVELLRLAVVLSLWAAVMAVFSLLPAVGTALVWLPVALWFLATGAIWQGVALAAWGVLVIGLVDNLLRPMLVGKATLMPDYVVMITTLGGMVVFGINGFVLGPVIAAMFFALWHMVLTARQAEASVDGPD